MADEEEALDRADEQEMTEIEGQIAAMERAEGALDGIMAAATVDEADSGAGAGGGGATAAAAGGGGGAGRFLKPPTGLGDLSALRYKSRGGSAGEPAAAAADGGGGAGGDVTPASSPSPAVTPKSDSARGTARAMLERGRSFTKAFQSKVDSANEENRKRGQRVFTAWESLVYLVFLALFTIVIFSSRDDQHTFYFTELLRDLIVDEEFPSGFTHIRKNFRDVATMEEFWQWFEGPLLNALYPEEWYNGDPMTREERRFVYGYNRLLGLVRLSQVRVRDDGCEIPPQFSGVVKDCYPKFSPSVADETDFAPPGVPPEIAGAFRFHAADDPRVNGSSYWGRLTQYYGGRFYIDLHDSHAANVNITHELMRYRWIDLHTRAVFVDFSVYNANLNLFCVVRILTEFPATGGAIPSSTFRAMKIFRYQTTPEYVVLVIELAFSVFVLYYIIFEIVQIVRFKLRYFQMGWNYLELINLPAFVIVIALHVYSSAEAYRTGFDPSAEVYTNFQGIGFYIDQERNVNAVNAFLCWFKLFKYLQVYRRLSQLSRTLARAAKNITTFLIMFLIVFIGFAMAFNLAFGVDVKAYRSVIDAAFHLFIAVLGDFDLEALRLANRLLGPLFFLIFQILVFFVMMNMFLAIINRAYEDVTREDLKMERLASKSSKRKFNLATQWLRVQARFGVKSAIHALDNADADNDGKLDQQELDAALKPLSATTQQMALGTSNAKEVMKKYDADGDGRLDKSELAVMRRDMEARQQKLEKQLTQVTAEISSDEVDRRLTSLQPRGAAARAQMQLERLTIAVIALKRSGETAATTSTPRLGRAAAAAAAAGAGSGGGGGGGVRRGPELESEPVLDNPASLR